MGEPTIEFLIPESVRSRRRSDAVRLLTLYLVFLLAIPSRFVFGPLGGAGSPSTILGVVLFVLYLVNWIHPSGMLDTRPQPIRRVSVLFLCAILVSYVGANLHRLSAVEQNGADRGVILICGWLGVLLMTMDGVPTMERLTTLVRRLVFGASAMAVLGIIQFFTSLNAAKYIIVPGLTVQQAYTDINLRGTLNRPAATAIHPIEFGFVLATILPLAIHQARYAPPELRFRRWLQVGLIAATLPMTVSRSALLGLAVCLIVILPTWPRRDRWMAYIVTVFGLFALRAVIPGLIGTLKELFLQIGTDSSTQSRTAAFGHAGPLISAHPWFGQGFSTFTPSTLFFTDDQYLNSLIEIGAVGLVGLLALFIAGWSVARRARRSSNNVEVRHFAQCVAASVGVAFIGFATFDALYFPMAAGLTFLIIGISGATWRLIRDDRRRDPIHLPPLAAEHEPVSAE